MQKLRYLHCIMDITDKTDLLQWLALFSARLIKKVSYCLENLYAAFCHLKKILLTRIYDIDFFKEVLHLLLQN